MWSNFFLDFSREELRFLLSTLVLPIAEEEWKDCLILRSVRRGARAEAPGAYAACVQLNALSRNVNFGAVKERLWYSLRLEERRFTLDKRSFDIGVRVPYRRSCSSGTRRRSLVRLRAPPPGQWERTQIDRRCCQSLNPNFKDAKLCSFSTGIA
ncbi:hypothetical protein DY000_02032572 [Brassica cretica]|uniref:Uncharacterized protein n=1 Tax=Brassica cretica TaxID=69181 RepID=A0ABQ7DVA7_BRACR|nr:hypothetical protein DY000_02032572 [Brassica cretica]